MANPRPGDGGSQEGSSSASRLGLALFALYLLAYVVFVGLNAFHPAVMQLTVGGVNLAVIYGLGLIAGAFALALLYAALRRERGDDN